MALRIMQVYLPSDTRQNPVELLEGREILGQWNDGTGERSVLYLLVPAEETEPIMDKLEEHYSDSKGFCVVLCPVEAVLPRLPELEEGESNGESNGEPNAQESERISREELYVEVTESLGVTRVFVAMTILSAIVAAVGLLRDDVAVIIGAMVIAPLLGPNVAMALATTLGDTTLLRQAVWTSATGVISAFLFAILVGVVFQVDPEIPSIETRTDLRWGDVLLAFSAGAAGTLAFTRGLPGAVIGVMVAVALMPPLVVCGILLGAGYLELALGAFLLASANVICVNLAGIVTFLLQGVRPRSWWEAEKAKQAIRTAIVIWVILLLALLFILWLNQVERVL
jgi:uncharacterized hydrophobic protein (TIGR00341 family)